MNKVNDFLEKLELSELEAKLYLTLVESGPLTVRDLASKAGIGRTTSYPYIDLLLEKGLIMKIVRGVHTLVAVNPPAESLQQIVDEKTRTINTIQKEFPEVVTILNSSINTSSIEDAEIRYYKGRLGIKKVYEEALKAKELRSYANFINGLTLPEVEDMFIEAFNKNPDLIMYELLGDTPVSRQQPLLHGTRYFRKYIPSIVKVSTTDILVYDGKVCIINLDTIPVGTVLQNKDYYIHTKGMFDYFWEILPNIKEQRI